MEIYNYSRALEIVETFMITSGIRNFCTNVCKGACCGGCYEGKTACHKNEGRRLSCSMFLCQDLLSIAFTPYEHKIYSKAYFKIKETLRHIMKKNIFYAIHTKRIQNKFKIDKHIIDVLNTINTESIKSKLNKYKSHSAIMSEKKGGPHVI